MTLRVVFAGTPKPALPALQAIADSPHEVVGVITRPDAPSGRGRKLTASPVGAWAEDHDGADWQDVIDVCLYGVVNGVREAYPLMIHQGFGHIVNTASLAGLCPAPLIVSYTAAKHGVVGLSRALRIEAKRHGVKVSVLCPGLVRTSILAGGRYGRIAIGLDAKMVARRAEMLRPIPPSVFARRALDAVEKNRDIIIVPGFWRLAWYLDRLSPRFGALIWEVALRRLEREVKAEAARQAQPP